MTDSDPSLRSLAKELHRLSRIEISQREASLHHDALASAFDELDAKVNYLAATLARKRISELDRERFSESSVIEDNNVSVPEGYLLQAELRAACLFIDQVNQKIEAYILRRDSDLSINAAKRERVAIEKRFGTADGWEQGF